MVTATEAISAITGTTTPFVYTFPTTTTTPLVSYQVDGRAVSVIGGAASFGGGLPYSPSSPVRDITTVLQQQAAAKRAEIVAAARAKDLAKRTQQLKDRDAALAQEKAGIVSQKKVLDALQAKINEAAKKPFTPEVYYNKLVRDYQAKAQAIADKNAFYNQLVGTRNAYARGLAEQFQVKQAAELKEHNVDVSLQRTGRGTLYGKFKGGGITETKPVKPTPFVTEFKAPTTTDTLPPFGLEAEQARKAIALREQQQIAAAARPKIPLGLEPITDFPKFVEERKEDIRKDIRGLFTTVGRFETIGPFGSTPPLSPAAQKAGEELIKRGELGLAFGLVASEGFKGSGEEVKKRGKLALGLSDVGAKSSGLGFVLIGEETLFKFAPEKPIQFDVPFIGRREISKGGFRSAADVAGQIAFYDAAFRFPGAVKATGALAKGQKFTPLLRLDQPVIDLFSKTVGKNLPTKQVFTGGKFFITETGEQARIPFLGTLEKRFTGKGFKVSLAKQFGLEESRPIVGFLDETIGARIPRDIIEPFSLETSKKVKGVTGPKVFSEFQLEFDGKRTEKFIRGFDMQEVTRVKTGVPGVKLKQLSIETGDDAFFRLTTTELGVPPKEFAKVKPLLSQQPITGKAFVKLGLEDDLAKGIKSDFFHWGQAVPTKIRSDLIKKRGVTRFAERTTSELKGFTIGDDVGKGYTGVVTGDIKGILEPEAGVKAKATGKLWGKFEIGDTKDIFEIKDASVDFISLEKGTDAIGKTIKRGAGKSTPFATTFGEIPSEFRNFGQNLQLGGLTTAVKQTTAGKAITARFSGIAQEVGGGIAAAVTKTPIPTKTVTTPFISLAAPGSATALAMGLPERPKGDFEEIEFVSSGVKVGEIPGFKTEPFFEIKTIPLSLTKRQQRFGIGFKTDTFLGTRTVPISRTELGLKLTPTTATIPIQKVLSLDIVAQKQRPVSIQKEQSILSQKLVPMQLFGLALRTRQPTRTATEQRLVTLAITPTTPVTTTPRVPLIPFLTLPRRPKPSETFGYKVFVRGKGVKTKTGWKRGEWQPLSAKVYSKKQAYARAGSFIDEESLKRSFKILPGRGKLASFIGTWKPERFRKTKAGSYVEKTQFALGRKEVGLIQKARAGSTKKRRKKKGKRWGRWGARL